MSKYFRRSPEGKWTSRSAGGITRLAGKRMSPVQEVADILIAMLEEGEDPEWAEDVISGLINYDPRGRKWWPLLKRWGGDNLDLWASQAVVLGKMQIGGQYWLLSSGEAGNMAIDDLLDLTGALQTAAVIELVSRGEGMAAATAMQESRWHIMRSPEKLLTSAMSDAPGPVREQYASVVCTSRSWISHAAEVALEHPPSPPPNLVKTLHRCRETCAYLAAATASNPPYLEPCRETSEGTDCCRAASIAAARLEWIAAKQNSPVEPRKFHTYSGKGELTVGAFPPADEGWEMTRRLKEGTWEWSSEVWRSNTL